MLTSNINYKDLFRRLDIDQSGKISLKNLQHILGTAYTQQELKDIIAEVDKLGDHEISRKEFDAALMADCRITAVE